jgi:hypothetical protein
MAETEDHNGSSAEFNSRRELVDMEHGDGHSKAGQSGCLIFKLLTTRA